LYLVAYARIFANAGAMTLGVTGKTVDGMSLAKISAIIDVLRHERYRSQPVKRVYPHEREAAPAGPADLVGQAGRRSGPPLLEAYYEPLFSDHSQVSVPAGLPQRVDRGGGGQGWDPLVHRGDISDCSGLSIMIW
jgi:hypothetical protein